MLVDALCEIVLELLRKLNIISKHCLSGVCGIEVLAIFVFGIVKDSCKNVLCIVKTVNNFEKQKNVV